MPEAAIFVSDLHLGTGDELDDFSTENEEALGKFLEGLSDAHMGEEVDLVVLGDFLDIWQVASDQEKYAANSTDIALDIKKDQEQRRVDQIIKAHPKAFTALRKFLAGSPGDRRLVCIPGNHDHSLIHPDLQEGVRQGIACGNPTIKDRVIFSNYYDAPELRTYGEHGNQFDANNDYDDFTLFGPECPGFYFVRLFWNRLEPKEPDIDVWWNIFRVIWERRLWGLLKDAYRLFRQYRTDPRQFERIDVPGIPFFAASGAPVGAPVTRKPLPEFPDILFGDGRNPELIFSTDRGTENRLRTFYHDPMNAEFKAEVDRILHEKFSGKAPQVPKEPVPPAPLFGLVQDPYLTAVAGMFADPGTRPQTCPMKGEALQKGKYDNVLFGHTHEAKTTRVDQCQVTYFNTGAWNMIRDLNGNNMSQLCYVSIRKSSSGGPSAVQRFWKVD